MSSLKDAGHLFRFAGLFVLAFLVFLVVRSYVVPKSFGEYGHYRGAAIGEIAAHPVKFAGHQTCETCHTDIADTKTKGAHAHVNCEACHGALAAHADDPTSVTPVKPDTAVLCARCHTASAAKPADFPQVDPADHSGGVPCETCHNPHSPVIGSDSAPSNGEGRFEMNITRRHLLILLPAAAVAWKHVLAGTPEDSPNYRMSEHWWGMLIDIPKCIGCGNCVRACQAENDVPDGFFRTWVERYHRTDWHLENPEVISPDGGKEGFPAVAAGEEGKYFFVPKMCNHCADSPCTQVCPVGATFVTPDGVVLIDQKYCLGLRVLRAGLPLRMPLHSSHQEGRGQVHALLPPDHQGADDGVLRGVPDGRAAVGRPEESQ